MYLPSSFILRYVIGLRWMCMHLWMNLIKRTTDIQEKWKFLKIYVQSQWRFVLLWNHIFLQSSVQRGQHTQLCIITSLKWVIQLCSNFYCWVCKIAFYSPNPHCCLGKLPKRDASFVLLWSWMLLILWFPQTRRIYLSTHWEPCRRAQPQIPLCLAVVPFWFSTLLREQIVCFISVFFSYFIAYFVCLWNIKFSNAHKLFILHSSY